MFVSIVTLPNTYLVIWKAGPVLFSLIPLLSSKYHKNVHLDVQNIGTQEQYFIENNF